MFILLSLLACDEALKSNLYDISSSVVISDETGLQLNKNDVEICQRFESEDFDTTTQWSVLAEQCEIVDVINGLATLSNWEGEYFGPDVSISLELRKGDEVFEAVLLDDDGDVWCDNQMVTDVDEHHNAIEYAALCDENYERYLLWSLVLPVDVL